MQINLSSMGFTRLNLDQIVNENTVQEPGQSQGKVPLIKKQAKNVGMMFDVLKGHGQKESAMSSGEFGEIVLDK